MQASCGGVFRQAGAVLVQRQLSEELLEYVSASVWGDTC